MRTVSNGEVSPMNNEIATALNSGKRILFFKSYVSAYTRKDGVSVAAHSDKRTRRIPTRRDDLTPDMFQRPHTPVPRRDIPVEAAKHPEDFTPDLFSGKTKAEVAKTPATFRDALDAGDLAGAIRMLSDMDYGAASEALLRAGFSLGYMKQKTTKALIASVQDQLLRATRRGKPAPNRIRVTPQVLSDRMAASIISAAADSIATLRRADVGRVLDETPAHYKLAMSHHIKERRKDLADEVDSVMAEEGFAKASTPRILFLKSHVKQFTRKDGTIVKEHDDKRTKKMQPMASQRPSGDEQPPSNQPPAKDPEDIRGSAHGYGTHNIEEGDSLSFKAGDFSGSGKVKSIGKDGAVVTDASGRDHNVHWHEVSGFKRESGDGGKKPPGDNDKPVAEGEEPPKKDEGKKSTVLGKQEPVPAESFNAADYAKSHDQADVSVDSILEGFPPDTKEKIAAVVERLASVEQTIDKMKNDPAYMARRTILHAKIKSEILSPERVKAATPVQGEKPTFVILGGRGGSGKSALTKPKEKGGLGLVDKNKFIVLDADAIKEMLPEYEGWNAFQVHEESGELFDEITRLATDLGLNICHDATMKTPQKAIDLVEHFNSSGYQTEAHYMHLPRQEAAKRAVNRFLGKTGRYVPIDVILGNTKNEGAFDAVKEKVGKWSFHDNNVTEGQTPIMISSSEGEKPMTKALNQPIILLWRRK